MTDLTLDQAASLTAGGAMWASVPIPNAGIPSFMMSDGPMGIASGRVDERRHSAAVAVRHGARRKLGCRSGRTNRRARRSGGGGPGHRRGAGAQPQPCAQSARGAGADGRLVYDDGTRVGYRGIARARHTLSSGEGYATFTWQNARVEAGGVAINVVNTVDRAGGDVVQVYRDAPETALIGFAKVQLEPGERRTVHVPLPRRRLMMWGDTGWMPIADRLTVRIARDAEDAGYPLELGVDMLAEEGI